MSERKEYVIDDFGELLNHKRIPLSSMERSKRKGSYPYYGASGIIDYVDNYIFEGEHVLISEDGENLKSRQTPIAFIANGKFWVNNHAHIFKGKKPFYNQLVVYYFANLDLNPFLTGAVQPKLNKAALSTIPIILPSNDDERKAIVSVLSSLDNKINLLINQNVTLEKMAALLFRFWFIEQAKESWEPKSLSSIASFLNGLACQKFPPKNDIDKLPVLKIKELSNGISENSDWASTDIRPEYVVKNGDVIFAWSASLMVKLWDGQDCILNQHLFKVTSLDYPKWFYYLWCKHHLAEFISIAASHATTMGHIKRGDLDDAKVLVPNPEELKLMTEQVEPLVQKIVSNNIQISTLQRLRNSLLPKLMNGEASIDNG